MKRILFFGLVVASHVFALAPKWLAFGADLTYQDPNFKCTSKASYSTCTPHLALFIEEGKVVRAALTQGSLPMPLDTTYFTDEELQGIELFTDPHGVVWLKKLPLSERLVARLYFIIGWVHCRTPKVIVTAEGGPFVYEFDTQGLGEDELLSRSQKLLFHGINKVNTPYEGSMLLVQRRRIEDTVPGVD